MILTILAAYFLYLFHPPIIYFFTEYLSWWGVFWTSGGIALLLYGLATGESDHEYAGYTFKGSHFRYIPSDRVRRKRAKRRADEKVRDRIAARKSRVVPRKQPTQEYREADQIRRRNLEMSADALEELRKIRKDAQENARMIPRRPPNGRPDYRRIKAELEAEAAVRAERNLRNQIEFSKRVRQG